MFVIPFSATRATSRATTAPRLGNGFDRVFDESLDRFFGRPTASPTSRTPALDVSESDTHYTLVFDVPGVGKDQLKVSVEGRRVNVETEVGATTEAPASDAPAADAAPALRPLYRERSVARYARTVVLPAAVDQAQSQARFDNGVLTLTLAKQVPAGATRISIQ